MDAGAPDGAVTVVVDGDAVDVDAVAGAAAASGLRSWSVGVGFGAGVARLAAVVRFEPEPGDGRGVDEFVAAIGRAARAAGDVAGGAAGTSLELGAEAERVDALCRRVATGVVAASRPRLDGGMLAIGGVRMARAAARFAAGVNGRRDSPLSVAGFAEGWVVAGLADDDPDLEGLRSALDGAAAETSDEAERPAGLTAAVRAMAGRRLLQALAGEEAAATALWRAFGVEDHPDARVAAWVRAQLEQDAA